MSYLVYQHKIAFKWSLIFYCIVREFSLNEIDLLESSYTL